ncbi:minor capsid protein [Salinicoccus roseus]|uniref:Minor capsid protein n=2 Tax=Salinicoccus roseus TaxID=45670 RepID=A0ABT4YKN4_9STAP|nr:minor capsid protein [Salinicoccus roseus]MDB0581383.1 minor capsid protein [Salinicoccus roseus]
MMFVESLVNHINANTDLNVSMNIRTEDSVLLRIAPSSPDPFNMDMQHSKNFSFQILTKHSNQFLAYSWIEQISQLLHGLSYSDIQDDDYNLIVLEETTSPNFVETNSSNQHIYTAIYNAEIIRK